MKILKTLGIILLVLVGAFAVYNAILDPHYEVERTITINATPDEVSEVVSDFKSWPEWSAWFGKDETMLASFGDPYKGAGATYSWTSENMGSGSMEILDYQSGDQMTTKIVFDGMGDNQGHWTFNAVAEGTEVSWGFSGDMPFFFRFMVPAMDASVGPDFEEGLANLKALIEQ